MFQFQDSQYTSQPRFSTMPVRMNPPTFKNGGRTKTSHLRDIANMLREQGEGEDKILAHINPEEAYELNMKHGSSGINPITGLPQFGGKRKMFRKILNIVAPVTGGRKALPTLGSIGGFLLGGPAGAIAGGALGGGLSGRRDAEGHRNFMSNVIRGAGTGAMVGAGGHFIGGGSLGGLFGGAGATPGISGPVAPVVKGIPSFASGLPSPAGQAGSGLLGGLGGLGEGLGGLLEGGKDLLGGLGISPIEALLGGTAIAGMAKGKKKAPPKEGMNDIPEFMRPRPDTFKPKGKFVDRMYVPAPEGYRPGIDPEHFYAQDIPAEEGYAYGGYLEGGSGGQDDDIHARLSPGEYVIDADVVSALGDGNNKAGAKKLDKMRENIRRHKRKAKPNAIPPKAKRPEQYFSNYVRR